MYGSVWEALSDVRECQEDLPNVLKWSGGPSGCPGVVGSVSRMSGSDWKTLPVVREWWAALPDVRKWSGVPLECVGMVGGPPGCPGVVGRPTQM